MAMFQWENVEQFIGLVNLLSMRNKGQVGPKTGKEDEDVQRNANDVGGDDSDVCDSKEDELKQRFLDRFAEMMSNEKGDRHVAVCSVALRESGDRCPEGEVKVSLLVSRNQDFGSRDKNFFSTLERLLATIGATVCEEMSSLPAVEKELWKELVQYNQPRLNYHAISLRDNLQAFKAAGCMNDVPPHNPSRSPQGSDSERVIFCDDPNIGPYSDATHDAYMKLAQERIYDLDSILCSPDDKATQLRLLVEHTYSIRHIKAIGIFLDSCPKASVGRKLLSDIQWLGRLRSCYCTLVEAAVNIPGFSQLSIIPVKNLPPRVCPSPLPTLVDVMKYLGQTLDPTSVKRFIGEGLGVIDAGRIFKEVQTTISRRHLPTHAELQLVLYIIRTMDMKTVSEEIYPYIGCSKLSCFLCAVFLKLFGQSGFTFRTRGSHGKIYPPWSIPDVDGLHDDIASGLNLASSKMRNFLLCELTNSVTPTAQVAESSAGVTDYNPQSSFIRQYHRALAVQREFDFLRVHTRKNVVRDVDPVEGGKTYNMAGYLTPDETPDWPGESDRSESRISDQCTEYHSLRSCSGCTEEAENHELPRVVEHTEIPGFPGGYEGYECYRMPGAFEPVKTPEPSQQCENCACDTSRRCSKCLGPWLCSERCESEWDYFEHTFRCAIGRPLDTADYLVRACWTGWLDDVDGDTAEDFGFAKFVSNQDWQKLFGLYVGLTRVGVRSRELHKWQTEGSLTENIMAKYEAIPQCIRGAHYPWFRKNLSIFSTQDAHPDFLAVARPYLDLEDRDKEPHELVPEAKRKSFLLYSMLLNGYHPNPSLSDTICKDLYFEFGFVTGCGSEGEDILPWVYGCLINRCPFTMFWNAFQTKSLITLMDEKGLRSAREQVKHLHAFLEIEPSGCCPTVWHLRLFVHSLNVDPPSHVAVDYGFFNCQSVEEKFALKRVYKEVLESPLVDPMELHKACIQGRLYDFVCSHNPNLEQRFKRLMSNTYPLPGNVKWAGMCTENVLILDTTPEVAHGVLPCFGRQATRIYYVEE
ncbi:hypothetical protein EDC04DRAFT_2897095 [Pisolithus marmoratus]|nr:hypothetical protein EDC04DRAFT_2897095 [Pisolithus marmoratus]